MSFLLKSAIPTSEVNKILLHAEFCFVNMKSWFKIWIRGNVLKDSRKNIAIWKKIIKTSQNENSMKPEWSNFYLLSIFLSFETALSTSEVNTPPPVRTKPYSIWLLGYKAICILSRSLKVRLSQVLFSMGHAEFFVNLKVDIKC